MRFQHMISTRRRGVVTGAMVLGIIGGLAVGLAPMAGAATTPARRPALHNGSVILDSGRNFTEPDGSEGMAGPGCRNLAQPGLASSVVLTGGPVRLYAGRHCSGRSAVITGSVADLATIGLDKQVTSIRFGR
jgi:hypothetical protein